MVNAKIKAASGGKRSLDDVTLQFNELARRGKPHTEAVWLSLVVAELGHQAIVDHEAFLAGKLFVPASDAFGPCFTRQKHEIGRFEIGFDPSAVQGHYGVVRNLIPESAAAKAGVREGDEVVSYDAGRAYFDATSSVTLGLKRDGSTIKVTYVPRSSEKIDTYQWVRVPGVPDSQCHI